MTALSLVMELVLLVLTALQGLVAARILELDEGAACEALEGRPGTCTLLTKCKQAGDFRRTHPPICTFRDRVPVICCPKVVSERLKSGLKAKELCDILQERCNERRDRYLEEKENEIVRHVIGGVFARAQEHIHMVLIGYGPASDKEWGCGGSLISSRFVLSAAHCAQPPLLGIARWARLGELDLSTTSDDAKTQDRDIVERILHPEYREPVVYNDIALFKLNRPVEYTLWVLPVCLYTESRLPDSRATVTGWGRIDFAGETSKQLMEADLDIYNETECKRLLPFVDKKTPRGIDTKLMFCAGTKDGSKDACSGDSGGPLVLSNPGQCLKTQIGVTSFGSQCGLPDSPGVYTKVSNYLPWIEEIAFAEESG